MTYTKKFNSNLTSLRQESFEAFLRELQLILQQIQAAVVELQTKEPDEVDGGGA